MHINITHLDIGGPHDGDPITALCGDNDATPYNCVVPDLMSLYKLCTNCVNHPKFALYELQVTKLEDV